MLNWEVNAFLLEAFDEPCAPVSMSDDGLVLDETHWSFWIGGPDRVAEFHTACRGVP